ncbi:hypothetical protein CHUAL_012084 [Chamberlinius hualienensis]
MLKCERVKMDRRKVAPKPDLAITEAWGSPTKPQMPKNPSLSYSKCNCCPYGYHIDVDFVKYCEALANEKYVRQLKQLHKDRKKQRKSMEIELGRQNIEQNQSNIRFVDPLQSTDYYKQHFGYLTQQTKPPCQLKRNSVHSGEGNERFNQHFGAESVRNEPERCFVDSAYDNGCLGENYVVYPPDVVNLGRKELEDPLKDAVDDFEEAYRVSTLERKRNRYPVDLLNVTGQNCLSFSSSSDSDTCILLSNDDEDLAPAGRYRSDSLSSLSTISTIHNNQSETDNYYYPNSPSIHMENTLASFDQSSAQVSSVNGPVSPLLLQNIRQQMAVSLQRMKELEEQAKAVPVLQVKLAVLKEEKRLLMLQLKAKDKQNVVIDSLSRKFRSVGVNCSALTRDVSVNHVSVETVSSSTDAKPLDPCLSCLQSQKKQKLTVELVGVDSIEPRQCSECLRRQKKVLKTASTMAKVDSVCKSTDTKVDLSSVEVQVRTPTRANSSQTDEHKVEVQTRNVLTETDKVLKKHFGCLFQPQTSDKSSLAKFEIEDKKTVGVECNLSLDNVTTCHKCGRSKQLGEDSSSEDDSSEEEEGSSPDEASYDSIHGTITHECGDDEAIRQGRPGAVMFTPKQKLTLTDELKESFTRLNLLLEKDKSVAAEDEEMKLMKDEWFKASSQKDSQGELVEEWLDAMEAVSPNFLSAVVNMSDSSGNTALHYAISHSNFDVVSLLLDSKVCDVNKSNKAGYNCIMLSSLVTVKEGIHLSVLKRLFKLSDVNSKAAEHGQTALILAASHGKVDMVRILHDAGADVNIQDKDGSSALMCASEHGHINVVRYLLAQPECQPNLVDNDGSNALSIAIEAGHKDIGLLIYAQTSFSRGSSPSSSIRRKSSTYSTSSSPLPTPPYSPVKSRKSTSSIQ